MCVESRWQRAAQLDREEDKLVRTECGKEEDRAEDLRHLNRIRELGWCVVGGEPLIHRKEQKDHISIFKLWSCFVGHEFWWGTRVPAGKLS